MSYFRRKFWGGADPYAGVERPEAELELVGFQERSQALADVVRKANPKRILEIGTHRGASAVWMAEYAPTAEVLCVDQWLVDASMFDRQGDVSRYALARDYFQRQVLSRNLEDRITWLPMQSEEFFNALDAHMPDMRFDMAYIDGGHDYRSAMLDLEGALRYVDGPIVVDDYELPAWPHVVQAVNDLAEDLNLQVSVKEQKAVINGDDLRSR